MEHATCLCRSYRSIERIQTVLLYVDGVLHPLSVLHGGGVAACSIDVGHTRSTLVIFNDIECARNLRKNFVVWRAHGP